MAAIRRRARLPTLNCGDPRCGWRPRLRAGVQAGRAPADM